MVFRSLNFVACKNGQELIKLFDLFDLYFIELLVTAQLNPIQINTTLA